MDKVIKAEYDEKAGTSEVTLMTKWGTFTRTVKVHDDDKDIANKWDGCYFANYLCVIDKLKAKGNALIQRAKGIEHAATVAAQARYAEGYSHRAYRVQRHASDSSPSSSMSQARWHEVP